MDATVTESVTNPTMNPFGLPSVGGAHPGHNMSESLAETLRLRGIIDALREPDRSWTIQEYADHLATWDRLKDRVVAERLRHLRRLEHHPIIPVNTHGTRWDLVDSFRRFVRHREHVEHATATAIVNDYKAIRALARFRGIPATVFPKPPVVVETARPELPSPEQVRQLMSTDYAANARNSYENHLVKYLLAFDFGFGPRFPSEAYALRIQDFNPQNHTIVIREPKKSMRTRRLYIEPEWLCCAKTRLSLANYATKWRPKVDVGGTDAFFLTKTGEPFHNELAISRYLEKRVKRRYPWYHGYLGRTWNATARLIDWGHDHGRVANWLGHGNVEKLRKHYEIDARLNEKVHGGNWLLRAFDQRTNPPPKKGVSSAFPPVGKDGPGRVYRHEQEETRTNPPQVDGVSSVALSHLLPSSFPTGVAA